MELLLFLESIKSRPLSFGLTVITCVPIVTIGFVIVVRFTTIVIDLVIDFGLRTASLYCDVISILKNKLAWASVPLKP